MSGRKQADFFLSFCLTQSELTLWFELVKACWYILKCTPNKNNSYNHCQGSDSDHRRRITTEEKAKVGAAILRGRN